MGATPRNEIINPAAVNNANGVSVVNALTPARITGLAAPYQRGTAFDITSNSGAAGASNFTQLTTSLANLGTNISGLPVKAISTFVWVGALPAGAKYFAIGCYNASGTFLGNAAIQEITGIALNEIRTVKLEGTALAGTTQINLIFLYYNCSTSVRFWPSDMRLDQTSEPISTFEYRDGASSGWAWTGTANASASQQQLISKSASDSLAVSENKQVNVSFPTQLPETDEYFTNWIARPNGLVLNPSAIVTPDAGPNYNFTSDGSNTFARMQNGRLEPVWGSTGQSAFYIQHDIGKPVEKLAAKIGFGPVSGAGSAIGLIVWTTPQFNQPITQSQCHFSITRTGWEYAVIQTGFVYTVIASETFATPLVNDWRSYDVSIEISGNTATIKLNNTIIGTVTDSRIGSIKGQVSCFEFFKNVESNPGLAIYRTSASPGLRSPNPKTTDTFTITESSQVSKLEFKSATDQFAIVDQANTFVRVESSDSFLLLDEITNIFRGALIDTSDAIAIQDQLTSIFTTQTRTEILAITEQSTLFVEQSKEDQIVLTDKAELNIIASDEFNIVDELIIDRKIESSDTFTVIDIARTRAWIESYDEFVIENESAYYNEKTVRVDDLISYTARDREQKWRVIAQNMFTKEFIHWSLPVQPPVETFNLTVPNTIQMEILTEIPSILDLDPPLTEGATWLHVEQDGEISSTYMLDPWSNDNAAQKRTLTGTGFSGYLNDVEYQGEPYKKIQIDPTDIIRFIWSHAQSFKYGNLGVFLNPDTKTPKRLGTEQRDVEFTTGSGQNVSFEAGPYDLNFWEVTNLGTEFNNLLKEGRLEYVERSWWNEDKTDVVKYIDLKYPRTGVTRHPSNTVFRQGENMMQPVPAINRPPDYLVNEVIVIGAGEGYGAIRARVNRHTGTKRKTKTIENEDITRYDRALAIAEFDMNRIKKGQFYIDRVVIDTMHENAKWGEWEQGDDIFIEGKARWYGKFSGFFRIENIQLDRRTKYAICQVVPSDAYDYGALEPT